MPIVGLEWRTPVASRIHLRSWCKTIVCNQPPTQTLSVLPTALHSLTSLCIHLVLLFKRAGFSDWSKLLNSIWSTQEKTNNAPNIEQMKIKQSQSILVQFVFTSREYLTSVSSGTYISWSSREMISSWDWKRGKEGDKLQCTITTIRGGTCIAPAWYSPLTSAKSWFLTFLREKRYLLPTHLINLLATAIDQ